ncbi:replication initiation protein [Oceanobacillus profundus]|uniref:Replication initiation protein n=2 Tax=Oceanobacillus profundus TaxID=372463 RepID=A0A417YGJ8_9BACI|nr:replication initiation protein [Oceanobacillus profundus]
MCDTSKIITSTQCVIVVKHHTYPICETSINLLNYYFYYEIIISNIMYWTGCMGEKIKKENRVQVYQANDLVEAIYEDDLTATEHKIIRYAAAKINKSPDHFPNVSFTVTEFINAAGISSKSYHSKVKKMAGELTRKRIRIKTEDEEGWFPWFKGIVYRSGMVHITFNDLIKPYLINLTEQGRYTKYSFPTIGNMQSPYTIRLFELLQQYAPIGKRTFELDKLKEHLGVKDKYKQYGHFKSRILMRVKEELDDINVLTYDFEEIKEGRKTAKIKFDIKITDSLDLGGNLKEEDIKVFLEKARPLIKEYGYDIPNRQIRAWTIFGIDELKAVLEDMQQYSTNVGHVGAYITTILKSRRKDYLKSASKINAKDEKTKDIIMRYLNESKGTIPPVPDWHIKNKLVGRFTKEGYSSEEFEKVWEENGEYIYNVINHKAVR